jgi:hypothetical protein
MILFVENVDHGDEKRGVEGIIVSERGQIALGRIAYWAAWVEATLQWVTLDLLRNLGPAGVALTKGRTAGQLIELCRALLSEGHPEPEGLSQALHQAKVALERRNQVLHSAIGGAVSLPEDKLVALWGRKGTARVVHESEFDAVAEELFSAVEALRLYV